MTKMLVALLLLLLQLLSAGVLDSRADCNVCSATSNAACVSATQFMFCENNLPIEPVNSCPSGRFCTAFAAICQSNNTLRSCNDCGLCNDAKNFACMGVRTFALCLNTQQPSAISGSCAPDYVCNKDNPNICVRPSAGSQATCPLVDDELSTTLVPGVNVDPNTYCRSIQRAGRFPRGNTLETTCRQYINCFVSNGTYVGALYNCPGSTYFNATSQLCGLDIPATCATSVTSLMLRSLRLA